VPTHCAITREADTMRHLPRSVAVLLAAMGAAGPSAAQQDELVQRAQRVLVSSLDSTFPRVPLEQWLAQLVGRSADTIQWETNDCGEGGDGLAAPTCVEALVPLSPDTTAHLSLIVAGMDGTPGEADLWMLYVSTRASISNFKGLPQWVAYVRRHSKSEARR
jgi:hypothetical protein